MLLLSKDARKGRKDKTGEQEREKEEGKEGQQRCSAARRAPQAFCKHCYSEDKEYRFRLQCSTISIVINTD